MTEKERVIGGIWQAIKTIEQSCRREGTTGPNVDLAIHEKLDNIASNLSFVRHLVELDKKAAKVKWSGRVVSVRKHLDPYWDASWRVSTLPDKAARFLESIEGLVGIGFDDDELRFVRELAQLVVKHPQESNRIAALEKGWSNDVARLSIVNEALRHERDALLIQLDLGEREDWTAHYVKEKCLEALALVRSGRKE